MNLGVDSKLYKSYDLNSKFLPMCTYQILGFNLQYAFALDSISCPPWSKNSVLDGGCRSMRNLYNNRDLQGQPCFRFLDCSIYCQDLHKTTSVEMDPVRVGSARCLYCWDRRAVLDHLCMGYGELSRLTCNGELSSFKQMSWTNISHAVMLLPIMNSIHSSSLNFSPFYWCKRTQITWKGFGL